MLVPSLTVSVNADAKKSAHDSKKSFAMRHLVSVLFDIIAATWQSGIIGHLTVSDRDDEEDTAQMFAVQMLTHGRFPKMVRPLHWSGLEEGCLAHRQRRQTSMADDLARPTANYMLQRSFNS